MANRTTRSAGGREQDTNAWMVTFSDLIMLLLTFFVLILTMSSMDQKKLKEIFRHLQEAVGILEFSGLQAITSPRQYVRSASDEDVKIILDQALLRNLLAPPAESDTPVQEALEALQKTAEITEDERGLVVSLRESVLFRPGEVSIQPEASLFLARLAAAIDACRNPILITGHSDDTLLRDTLYASNWELSLHRALAVLDYFLVQEKLPSSRFMVGAAGASRPVSHSRSPEGRARNRRVDIIFQQIEGL